MSSSFQSSGSQLVYRELWPKGTRLFQYRNYYLAVTHIAVLLVRYIYNAVSIYKIRYCKRTIDIQQIKK